MPRTTDVIRHTERCRSAVHAWGLRFAGLGLVLAGLTLSGCSNLAARGMNAEGVRLFQQGQYVQAIQQFQQAIYSDPNNADGYYNMAAVYHQMGKAEKRKTDLEQAENLYNQCLDRAPEHCDCYRGLAVLLVEQKRNDEAFRLLQGWCDRNPASADARIELARLCEEFGDQQAAMQHLSEALMRDPNNPRALAAAGKLREQMGDQIQAMANYQRSLFFNRFQPEVASRLAALQTATGVAVPQVTAESTEQIASRNFSMHR
jgi:tetratricopeptide (TPR) repeat protein